MTVYAHCARRLGGGCTGLRPGRRLQYHAPPLASLAGKIARSYAYRTLEGISGPQPR
jgi:hypothetical protein